MTYPIVSTNGTYAETWLGRLEADTTVAITGYCTADGGQHILVAGSRGVVKPLTIGPPGWQWAWTPPIGQHHGGIVGVVAYFHPGDGRHHCFVAVQTGDIFEIAFASLDDRSSLSEIWIGKLEAGALGIAGFSAADKSQHLFVAGQDGFVHPLEIGPSTTWVWAWREPISAFHEEIVGISAYWHPHDNAQHVFIALGSGDVWEMLATQGASWQENWLGVLDGGATVLAGHSAFNGTQHLFATGTPGWVLPLQLGPPHWMWRWDNRVMSRRDAIAGLATYFNANDSNQHVVAALQSGDIWESRFHLRSAVATLEWNPSDFPISYWDGPLGLDNLQTKYQQVVDGGFTLAIPSNAGGDIDSNHALLAAAGASGLRMFVKDDFVQSFRASTGLTAKDKEDIQAVIDSYSGHSAFAGCQLVGQNGTDELFPNDFAINGELVDFFRSKDPGHSCFLEIIAKYGDGAYSPLTYDDYVEEYLGSVRPTVLCFHNYSLQSDFPNSFYENLRIIRYKAIAHGLPFWQFVVSTGHGAFRSPTEAELRRQAMQVLAFGGTGVLWFTYAAESGWETAIVDQDGMPSSKYPEIQRVNADVRAIGNYLLDARNIAVFESGVLSGGGTPPPVNGLVRLKSPADVTIGEFSIEAVPGSSSATRFLVMLANRNADNAVSAKVEFSALNVQKLDRTSDTWNPVGLALGPVETEVILAPGDGELFSVFAP
jgi:hypothetical protein